MSKRPVLGWRFLKWILESRDWDNTPDNSYFLYGFSQEVIHKILCASIAAWPPTPETTRRVWDWIRSHIHEGSHETPFFRCPPKSAEDHALHSYRVIQLAEALYNLQAVPFIHDLIYKRIFNNPAGLEGTMLELDGLRCFWMARIPFRLNLAGSEKVNHDCDITLRSGVSAHCEMKCKVEGAEFSKEAIIGPMTHARKQLPKGGCGIVFLKIPSNWGISSEVNESIEEAVHAVFRTTSRIAEVVVYRSDFSRASSHDIFLQSVKEIINPKSSHLSQLGGGVFNGINFSNLTNWVPFVSFYTKADCARIIAAEVRNIRN